MALDFSWSYSPPQWFNAQSISLNTLSAFFLITVITINGIYVFHSLKRSFYILNCLYAYLNDDFTFYELICFNNGRIAVFGECVKERTFV